MIDLIEHYLWPGRDSWLVDDLAMCLGVSRGEIVDAARSSGGRLVLDGSGSAMRLSPTYSPRSITLYSPYSPLRARGPMSPED